MTRYTLTVPLQLNDGTPTPTRELTRVGDALARHFGGWTSTDSAGAWVHTIPALDTGCEQVVTVYQEPVRVFTVDTTDEDAGPVIDALARLVAVRLDQHAVYVTEQRIETRLITREAVAA